MRLDFFHRTLAVVRPAVNIKDNVYNMEEAQVLEPLEHSVLKKPLYGESLEGRSSWTGLYDSSWNR